MSKRNVRLVWSDDPKDKVHIEGRSSAEDQLSRVNRKFAPSSEPLPNAKFIAVFRLEKGGRGGKTVTVIDQLPKQSFFLRELCRELKTKCGSGGTYVLQETDGRIEIQGDQRTIIKSILEKKGIRFKGM